MEFSQCSWTVLGSITTTFFTVVVVLVVVEVLVVVVVDVVELVVVYKYIHLFTVGPVMLRV